MYSANKANSVLRDLLPELYKTHEKYLVQTLELRALAAEKELLASEDEVATRNRVQRAIQVILDAVRM